jgi:hypothetical protein
MCLVLVLLLSVVECATANCLAGWRKGLGCDDMEQQVQPAGAAQDLVHVQQLHKQAREQQQSSSV